MLRISEINAMSPSDFAKAFGAVYEHSPWVAERAFAFAPFLNRPHLHSALVASVQSASEREQLALLNAHPELAGKEAAAGALTQASTHEQASAGLTAMTAELVMQLRALNATYCAKFGFPFIIAVRNNTQASIFGVLAARLHNSAEMERNTALMNVGEIARLRLLDLVLEE
jgi:2-oxo-4-hydroxy-4-carboxy-5-ureidoimidazoline decarboxylase